MLHLLHDRSSVQAMIPPSVEQRIREGFETLSPGMKKAGRYVLDHPEDVALLTMREQSRRAGVPAATMTRFSQRLGYAGFNELRALFAASMRGRVSDFSQRADALAARREKMGERNLATSVVASVAKKIDALRDDARLGAIMIAADMLFEADCVLCLGHRSCYAPAYHFAYTAGLNGTRTVLLDAPGGIGIDPLGASGASDVMLAVSFAPYTRRTIEIAASAHELGVPIVALTDNPLSPLARIATHVVVAQTDIGHAAYATAPIFAVAEILATLIAARAGPQGRQVLERNETELTRRRTYWAPDEALPA